MLAHRGIRVAAVLLALTPATAGAWPRCPAVPDPDAAAVWGCKPVLPVLLATPGRTDDLSATLGLGAADLDWLLGHVLAESEGDRRRYEESEQALDLGLGFDARAWNERSEHAAGEFARRFESRLLAVPRRRAAFAAWLQRAWGQDQRRSRGRRPAGPFAPPAEPASRMVAALSYEVFATQYAANTDWEIAVPDKYVKFANLGWEHHSGYEGSSYSCTLDWAGGHLDAVWVGDVGPWNIEDNYWNGPLGPRPRRMWTDLPQGRPESEAAYYDNYNGGLDQYARSVSNPAGLDQSLAVAAANGLAYLENTWMTVSYDWETGDGGAVPVDADGDGWAADSDCNDGSAGVFPGAAEAPDGVDNDCDGLIDEGTDQFDDDGDGFSEAAGDCADGDATIHPGASDPLDGADNDCDGLVDEDAPPGDDDDGTGADDDTAPEGSSSVDDDGDGSCEGPDCEDGSAPGDCDDGNPAVHPGATETANGLDDDCDGLVDASERRVERLALMGASGCAGGCTSSPGPPSAPRGGGSVGLAGWVWSLARRRRS